SKHGSVHDDSSSESESEFDHVGAEKAVKVADELIIEPSKKKPGKVMTAKERMTGAAAWNVYTDYITWSGGRVFIISAIILLLLFNGSRVGNDLWLSLWTRNPPKYDLPPSVWAGVYVGWGVAQALFGYLVGILFALSGVRAS